jgi:hypothetical protein
MIFDVSIGLVVLGIIAYMALGALWYSPSLFGGPWMRALGKKKEDMSGAASMYVVTAICVAVTVVGLAYFISMLGLVGWDEGIMLGFQAWLFFAATSAMINRLFQGMNWKVYMIDMGYHLAGMVIAGAIVAS